ncbi:glycosyltransferase family 2 protein [Photobacterium satsumensis]|uniref:glycosyltransferase family 2 protein n=1 Tax=Photobacterium satsumensis TaxID=2910239 RepID=UPI003D133F70
MNKRNSILTVITPTYNRSDLLAKLKTSLDAQACYSFKWLIIDDGSSDETEQTCKKWITEASQYEIEYVKQVNGGKHRAVNHGITLVSTALAVIVDSDDICLPNFIEEIYNGWDKYSSNQDVGCVSFLCQNENGEILPEKFPYNEVVERHFILTYKYGIHGDKVDVFRAEALKENLFPEIDGEKFITEEVVWNRIAKKWKKVGINQSILEHVYFDDGLTKKYSELLINNHQGTALYFKERAGLNIGLYLKIRSLLSYVKFKLVKYPKVKSYFLNRI